jgi:hypothetical protein
MALPVIDRPLFKVVVPIIEKEYTLRPYLMKEEKILLLAQQGNDQKQIALAIKQVITNCVVGEHVDVDTLPNFVLEYLLLQLRISSVGSEINVAYRDNEDDQRYEFDVDLNDIELSSDPNHTDAIELNDTVGLLMKYPNLDIASSFNVDSSEEELVLEMVRRCIDKVFTEEEVFDFSEYTFEEQEAFLDQLDRNQVEKIIEFFQTMPTLSYTINYKNSMDNDRSIEMRTLSDFFI